MTAAAAGDHGIGRDRADHGRAAPRHPARRGRGPAAAARHAVRLPGERRRHHRRRPWRTSGATSGRTVTPLVWRTRLDGAALDRALTAVAHGRLGVRGAGQPDVRAARMGGHRVRRRARGRSRGGRHGDVRQRRRPDDRRRHRARLRDLQERRRPRVGAGHEPPASGSPACGRRSSRTTTTPRAAPTPPGSATWASGACGSLEGALPAGSHVIGVDEHTALVFDLATGMATVLGNGAVTVRHDGRVARAAERHGRADRGAGRTVGRSGRRRHGRQRGRPCRRCDRRGEHAQAQRGRRRAGHGWATRRWRGALPPPTSLRAAADRARAAFDAALTARDADAAAAAVLDLEQAITDWTADTLQSDDGDHARRTLRGMVLELAGAARDGLADPATRIAPLVDALLERRAAARSARTSPPPTHCATASPPQASRSATARPAPSGACAIGPRRDAQLTAVRCTTHLG